MRLGENGALLLPVRAPITLLRCQMWLKNITVNDSRENALGQFVFTHECTAHGANIAPAGSIPGCVLILSL